MIHSRSCLPSIQLCCPWRKPQACRVPTVIDTKPFPSGVTSLIFTLCGAPPLCAPPLSQHSTPPSPSRPQKASSPMPTSVNPSPTRKALSAFPQPQHSRLESERTAQLKCSSTATATYSPFWRSVAIREGGFLVGTPPALYHAIPLQSATVVSAGDNGGENTPLRPGTIIKIAAPTLHRVVCPYSTQMIRPAIYSQISPLWFSWRRRGAYETARCQMSLRGPNKLLSRPGSRPQL